MRTITNYNGEKTVLDTDMASYGKYLNGGYKDLKGTDLGQHAQVGRDLLTEPKKVLKPSDKLIYATIKLYQSSKTGKSACRMSKLASKTGYKEKKINNAVQKLEKLGYLSIEKIPTQVQIGPFEWQATSFNLYSFPIIPEQFENFTAYFLVDNTRMTNSTREFLLLLMPFLMRNDTFWLNNTTLSKNVGLDVKTVRKNITELEGLGYLSILEDAPYRVLDTKAIMFDAYQTALDERAEMEAELAKLKAK